MSDSEAVIRDRSTARDAVAVMDEAAGRSAAEVEGVETRGTAYVVLAAVRDGTLSTAKGRDAVDAIIDHGWHVAPDVYTKIVGKSESLGSNWIGDQSQ